ncbi:MAG: hypothetical protein C0490_16160 [Marivirga sp.]|nr:hypothetical protein [Marivirga sp.]
MKKTNFDQLLERYLNGQLSEQEKIKLEAWLNVVKTTYKEELVLTPDDEDRLFSKITSKIDNLEEVVSFLPQYPPARSFPARSWFRIAATLSLLIAASYGIWFITTSKSLSTPAGTEARNQKMILNDGTIVWLQRDSKLSYYQLADTRHAELTGEALFEVAKDKGRPFIITCGDVTATVVGTSFNIKSGKHNVELTVLTGKVNLSSSVDSKGINVLPLEKVIYDSNGRVEKVSPGKINFNSIGSFNEYHMQFIDTPMSHVLSRIEKKFNVHVSLENKALTNCRITADFTDKSLEHTLHMLSELLDLEYKVKGASVVISGKGCK